MAKRFGFHLHQLPDGNTSVDFGGSSSVLNRSKSKQLKIRKTRKKRKTGEEKNKGQVLCIKECA